jgi:hypothetical protein
MKYLLRHRAVACMLLRVGVARVGVESLRHEVLDSIRQELMQVRGSGRLFGNPPLVAAEWTCSMVVPFCMKSGAVIVKLTCLCACLICAVTAGARGS